MALGISWIGLQRELETLPKEALVQKFKQGDPRYPQVLIGTVLQGVVDMENRFALAEGQKKGDAAPPDVMTQILEAVEGGIPSVDRGAGEQVPPNRLAALQGGIAAPPPAQAQAGPGAPMMAARGGLIPGYQAGRTVQGPGDDRTVEEMRRIRASLRAALSAGTGKHFSSAARARAEQVLQEVDSLLAERDQQDALWKLIAQHGDPRETAPYSFDPEGTGRTDAEQDALWELIAQHGDPRETVSQLMEGVETSIPTPGGSMYDDLAGLLSPAPSAADAYQAWLGGGTSQLPGAEGGIATRGEEGELDPYSAIAESFTSKPGSQGPSAADAYQAWLEGGTPQSPGAYGAEYGMDELVNMLGATGLVPDTTALDTPAVEYGGFDPMGFEDIMALKTPAADALEAIERDKRQAVELEGVSRHERLDLEAERARREDTKVALDAAMQAGEAARAGRHEILDLEAERARREDVLRHPDGTPVVKTTGETDDVQDIFNFLGLDPDAPSPGSGRDKRYSEMEDKLERLLNFDVDAGGPRELTSEELAYQTMRGEVAEAAFKRAEGVYDIEQENIRDSIAELPTADQRQAALDSIAWGGIGQLFSQGPRAMTTGLGLLADKMRNWGANEEATKMLRMAGVREDRLESQRNIDTAQSALDNVGLLMSQEAATRGPQAAQAALPYFLNLWLREATELGLQERHRQDLLLAMARGGAGGGTPSTEELGKLVEMVDAWQQSLASSKNPFTGEELSDDEVQSVRRVLLQIREILRMKSLGGAIGVDPMTLMEEMRDLPPGAEMGFDYLRLLQKPRAPATPN